MQTNIYSGTSVTVFHGGGGGGLTLKTKVNLPRRTWKFLPIIRHKHKKEKSLTTDIEFIYFCRLVGVFQIVSSMKYSSVLFFE